MNVLFTFKIKDEQLKNLQSRFPEVHFEYNKELDESPIDKFEVIVTYGEDINTSVLEKATSLKWLMVASAGVEKMPLSEIAERGIVISNVRGIHKTPMAESVIGHILSLTRALPSLYDQQKRKEWNTRVKQTELRGSTAIILGPGAIGSEIGRLLQAFGVRTIGCNQSGRPAESMDETIQFDNLIDRLPDADYVISILPSTAETKGLLDERYFKAMKPTATFMNFGRGDLVKESILVDALKNGEIGHAVLDVFEKEPILVDSELWNLSNVSISPHVSSHSGKYIERALEFFIENLEKWQNGDGELVNLVDPKKGY
ncbi:D-2-hydroxyacid dehydrogenase [Sporosarcina thermotolerans]|uniref:D-2-hydroxyacid dehydrogenase n=1 Tax=Sporosarcina thermotolerans TaxID=633404 RepID=A0AAW9A9X9_9BACL|nr:D-2-hydroxyacid dehydrogenase [Sporosarcina thermotolerans]MDW0117800.1 D-2-hydroxyacid dehydrogenase [Sporosarcina thermotolerans]WHT49880.1 D-2-hydroxyacid dehydrogenase [Sporosarcina thermotolerans]